MKISKLGLIIAISLLVSTKVHAQTIRIGGMDRYETSVEISKNGWQSSDNIILANGEGDKNFADALSGTLLAYNLNAPMLLTSTWMMDSKIKSEISRLKAKNIYILGGTAVISGDLENWLKSNQYNVIRIAGQNRYETATKIADQVLQIKTADTAYLVTGYEFQYAMLASSLASKVNAPLLFTENDGLNDTTKQFLLAHSNIKNIKLVGLKPFVSDKLQKDLNNIGLSIESITGNNLNELQG